MTVAEAIEILEDLPPDDLLTYHLGDQLGTILDVAQIELVNVEGHAFGFYARDDGPTRVAAVA